MAGDSPKDRSLPLAERLGRAVLEADAVVAVRSRAWWRSLPRKFATLVVIVLLALAGATYLIGGVDRMASTLLSKEIRNTLPISATVRRVGLAVVALRPATPESIAQVTRLAHVLDADDPLWVPVVRAAGTLLGQDLPLDDEPTVTLAALDRAAARALGRPLEGAGVLAWRPIDPYFVESIEELASTDPAVGVHRFNSLRPPDGLPTSEWYLDELVLAFGDARPVAFALVADSTGDDWRPLALPPDQVPPNARRIRAATVGEVLRAGLWGLEDLRPATPDTDVVSWWRALATARGLPTFEPPS